MNATDSVCIAQNVFGALTIEYVASLSFTVSTDTRIRISICAPLQCSSARNEYIWNYVQRCSSVTVSAKLPICTKVLCLSRRILTFGTCDPT